MISLPRRTLCFSVIINLLYNSLKTIWLLPLVYYPITTTVSPPWSFCISKVENEEGKVFLHVTDFLLPWVLKPNNGFGEAAKLLRDGLGRNFLEVCNNFCEVCKSYMCLDGALEFWILSNLICLTYFWSPFTLVQNCNIHTGAKIVNSSKKSHFKNLKFHKIHILKILFFTKFTFSKSCFSQNSHFSNIKFLVIYG